MKIIKKRSISALLTISLGVSIIVPLHTIEAAASPPSFTGVFQKDDHVKLEWAVEMHPSDVLAETSFETGQEIPNLSWGWDIAQPGNQSIVQGSNGTKVLQLTDTFISKKGNWYNYPETQATASINHYEGKSVPSGSTLSLSYKARTTGSTSSMIYPFVSTGWFKKGYERTDDNGRIIRFGQNVDFNNPPTEFAAYVDDGNLSMNNGTTLVVVSSHGTNYDYGVIYYNWDKKRGKFVRDSVSGVWNNPTPLGQQMTMRKDVFSSGEPLLVYREQAATFPTRWTTSDGNWTTYNANVYISDNPDYDFSERGVKPYFTWSTDGKIELDDYKLGYATEVEVYRDSQTIYRGYLSDYEDMAATDKAKPNEPSNTRVTIGPDRKPKITWNAVLDTGTTYNYQIKGYPKNTSQTSLSVKNPVTVTSGIKGYSVVIDQNPNTTPPATITTTGTSYTASDAATGNFYVHIAAVDKKNNVSNVVHIPYNDTINPNLDISSNNDDWTSNSVVLTVVASDNETGIKKIQLPDGTSVNESSANYTATQNGNYSFVAEDNAGNKREKNIVIENIDLTNPVINISPQDRPWSDENIDIVINYKDLESGIDPNKRLFKATNSPNPPTDWEVASSDNQVLTIREEGVWYIHAKATDRVGNEIISKTDTLRLQGMPESPVLQLNGIEEDEAKLEWTLPNGSTLMDGYSYHVENLTTGQSWQVQHPTNHFTDSSLNEGSSYQYRVVAKNHVGQGESNIVDAVTLPGKPSSIKVSKDGREANRALVTIEPVHSATGYRIVATDAVTDQEVFNQTVTDTVYQPITNLLAGTVYNIAVSAINATGEGKAEQVGFLTLPDAPSSFSGLEITDNSVTLGWNNVLSATYFELERDLNLIYGGEDTSYHDEGLESGTSYSYRISAENESGSGEYSTLDDVKTLPAAVLGLKRNHVSTSEITIEWESVRGADGYTLSFDGGEMIHLPENVTQFVASGLQPGSSHKFIVAAQNQSGVGISSSLVLSTIPDVPNNIEVSNIGEQEVTLFIPEVQGATKYLVSVNGQQYETSSGELLITGLAGGQTYSYQVAAGNMAGYSEETTGEFLTLPFMPNNVEGDSTVNSINLRWDAVPSATEYLVYDTQDNLIDKTNNHALSVNNLEAGSEYQFNIRAINESGESKNASFTWWTVPDMPEQVTIDEITENGANIKYSEVEGAIYYEISLNGQKYIRNSTNLQAIDLTPGKTYEYTIKSGNRAGEGRSYRGSFMTLPDKIEKLKAVSTKDSISLQWEKVESATSYKVYNEQKELIDEIMEANYQIKQLEAGTEFSFTVEALNPSGSGKGISISYVTIPALPTDVTVSDISEKEATIRIPTVHGAVYYEIETNEQIEIVNDNQLHLTDLTPGTTYSYSVAAGNRGGTGEKFSGEFITLPDQVENVVAKPLADQITLKWNSVKSAVSYEIYDQDEQLIATTSSTEFLINDLKSGSEYIFYVNAVNDSGRGIRGEVSSQTLPGVISEIIVTDIDETQALVSFSSVTGATYYTLNVNEQSYELQGDTHELLLTELSEGTEYKITAVAGNLSGKGLVEKTSFYTLPIHPEKVRIGTISADTVTIIWDKVMSATSYRVITDQDKVVSESSETRATLTNLEPGKNYTFFVQAKNKSGYSKTTPITFRTHPEKAQVEVNVKEVTETGASLSWDSVKGVDGYKIYLDGELIDTITELNYKIDGYKSASMITGWSIIPFNEVGTSATIVVPDIYTLPSDKYKVMIQGSRDRELEFIFDHELQNEIFVVQYRGNEVYRGTDKSFRLPNLMYGSRYSFDVWTENAIGDKSISKVGEGRTFNIPVNPTPPVIQNPEVDEDKNEIPTEIVINNPFKDINKSFAKEEILKLYELGIIKGTGSKFEPGRPITRIEFVSLLVRSLDLKSSENVNLTFKDINTSGWYAEDLKAAVENNVASGFNSSEFRPHEVITREQASKMLAGAIYGYMIPDGDIVFSDVSDISGWAKDEVAGLGVTQLIQGYPDGTFRPKGKLTRAESAALIYRMYELINGSK
ncbi:fibronectin type III domain-containing protein [Paenibacillus gallinarum]|uniref:Fibronectin type III domain-containing protein n=1 Tax=Paenibacillus gallinarum TaxID=2762232 RepID=A0ABR8T406_9BACL|nr:fibronectin type III domain-containing protein [Paenibacillus gallinarum]MBD7970324.1 fibronectin type III domain-containing protein [Paenibacillus gallinarum]